MGVYVKLNHALVCLDYYNRIPQAKWLINYRNLFLSVLEAKKSKIKIAADSVSGENLISGSQMDGFSL